LIDLTSKRPANFGTVTVGFNICLILTEECGSFDPSKTAFLTAKQKVKNIPNQPFVIQSNNCTFAARNSG